MYDAPRSQRTANSRVGPAEYFELFSDDGRPTGGERPAALLEPWPLGKMDRHDGIAYELVQALDALVLQTVEQLPNVVQFFAAHRSAQDPASRCSSATFVSRHAAGGTAGGSADAVSYSSSFQRTVEQPVDIPVPGRAGRASGLQGFLPGQGSTALRSSQKRNFLSRIVEQIVDFPSGGLQDFRPEDKVHLFFARSSFVLIMLWMRLVMGFFRTFPQMKKSVTLLSSSWTPSAYDVPMVLEEEEEESELEEAEEVDEVASMVEYVECNGRWWGATVGPDGAADLLVARCG